MADLFGSPASNNNYEGLFDLYILYFDEEKGHLPLLMYPHDEFKEDKKFMRPIKYHSIWFLDVKSGGLDHVDLEYKGWTFFGKKFLTQSKRIKRRAGLDEETPEVIVIIYAMPNDIAIFGEKIIKQIHDIVQGKYDDKLFKIISGEIAKDEIIKTPKVKKAVEEGTKIKEALKKDVLGIIEESFANTINKKSDLETLKKQKAISYLALRGIDVGSIGEDDDGTGFSNISLFDPNQSEEPTLEVKKPFTISDINVIEDSQEIEILVSNNTSKEIEVSVKITHVKEFFEKEIMNQAVDLWYPDEELLFISPIIPHINEYLFFIIEEDNKNRLLSSKIDIDMLNKIKS